MSVGELSLVIPIKSKSGKSFSLWYATVIYLFVISVFALVVI